MGLTQSWCCWQTDRNGNWDIYGSYVYGTGIGGKDKVVRTKDETLLPALLTRAQLRAGLLADPSLSVSDAAGRRVFAPKSGVFFLRSPTTSRKVLVTD